MKKILLSLLLSVFFSTNTYCQFIDDMIMDAGPQTKRESLISAFGSSTKQKAVKPKDEKKEASKPEFFYPFVSGELDTTGSCWYDDKVYLLAVKSDKKAVITILPYGFRFYEGTLSPRNGFEKKLRETKTDIICWGQSSQIANPRCYFFLEPVGQKESFQIYIQKAIGDKVSEPVLFTFRRDMGSGSLSSKENMGGLGRGSPFPSNRARLSNGQR